jgi:hypothetical protein
VLTNMFMRMLNVLFVTKIGACSKSVLHSFSGYVLGFYLDIHLVVVLRWREDVTGRGLFAPYSPTPKELIQKTLQVGAFLVRLSV